MIGRICGTGSCLPRTVWTNEKLEELVDTSGQWIEERTGICERHIAEEEETTAYLASEAAKEAVLDSGLKAQDIDLILAATISPGRVMPGVACEVQKNIGASNATCFDLNAACTGFLFALNTAQAYIAQGIYKNALVIGAENLSNLTNWKDRGTCILFGDGAGAVVVKGETEGLYEQVTHSIGEKGEVLTLTDRNQKKYEASPNAPETYMQMDGKAVFQFAVTKVPEAVREVLEKAGMKKEEVSFYILHQANERIILSAAKRLGESMEKFPVNMKKYGNTSSASIPILLDELNKKGAFKRGENIVLSGFGAGLSYGASILKW